MSEPAAEKPHEPTSQRLEEARRQGDVPHSADLTAAAALGGLAGALALFGPGLVERAGRAGVALLAAPGRAERAALAGPAAEVLLAAAPLFLVPAAAAAVALAAQRAVVLAPVRLAPRLERISPFAAARKRFGPEGLTDFARSAAKLVLVGAVVAAILVAQADLLLMLPAQDARLAAARIAAMLGGFVLLSVVLATVLGALDLLLQRVRFIRRNRMSRQELLEEMKRSEGDPQLKAERRDRGRAIAMNRMLADVPKADVVIVNPQHYAVALRWDRTRRGAPVCVAKGVDAVAARIREAAAAAGVPVHRDPPTARALHAALEVGDMIRPEHYRAVAAAIRFADAMRRRAAAVGRRR